MSELRALLERFAKRKSMDIIFDAANTLIDDANMDEELEAWFKDLKLYVRKVRPAPSSTPSSPTCYHRSDSFRQFHDGKDKSHFDNLFQSVGDQFKPWARTPQINDSRRRLTRDLLFDHEGSLKFMPDLWTDIRKVILPTLVCVCCCEVGCC